MKRWKTKSVQGLPKEYEAELDRSSGRTAQRLSPRSLKGDDRDRSWRQEQ